MAILSNCEIFYLKADPARPSGKMDPNNPQWEVQIRTRDIEQKGHWEAMGIGNIKMTMPNNDPAQIYFYCNLRRKAFKSDGSPSPVPEIQGGDLMPIDPNTVGNGSVGNVRIYQYPHTNRPGQLVTMFTGIQILLLRPYTRAREGFEAAGPTQVVHDQMPDNPPEATQQRRQQGQYPQQNQGGYGQRPQQGQQAPQGQGGYGQRPQQGQGMQGQRPPQNQGQQGQGGYGQRPPQNQGQQGQRPQGSYGQQAPQGQAAGQQQRPQGQNAYGQRPQQPQRPQGAPQRPQGAFGANNQRPQQPEQQQQRYQEDPQGYQGDFQGQDNHQHYDDGQNAHENDQQHFEQQDNAQYAGNQGGQDDPPFDGGYDTSGGNQEPPANQTPNPAPTNVPKFRAPGASPQDAGDSFN